MKKLLVLLLALAPLSLCSQNILNKLKNKVKNKAEQRVEKKVDKGIDKAFDKTEDAAKPKNAGKESKPANAGAEQPKQSASATLVSAEPALKSYSRFDFVPGEDIVYTENFGQEAIGELPAGWNTSGNGEVVTLSTVPGKWMRLYQNNVYLTSNEKEFGENFTIEFDLILQLQHNNSGHFYPYFSFALFSSNGEPAAGNNFLREYKKYTALEAIMYPAEHERSKIITSAYRANKVYFRSDEKRIGIIERFYGKPVHIAVQVQKERCRMWINEEKVCDFPKAIPLGDVINQLQFQVHISSYKEDQYGVYINNLKVAKGIPDTRHKLIEEGKFSTTGILFDVNSDQIKPESYAVMKGIATVLKENAGVRVKIIGHTDSDGKDSDNLTLSQKRAAAVVKMLSEEFDIEASRMEPEGMGESQPVGDNKTQEGKAMNRRVEFVKL